MCRLFGLTAAPHRVHARFWLLEAPDSLSQQSRQNADGTGLGIFNPEGAPVLDKQPIAAYEDMAFAGEARHLTSMGRWIAVLFMVGSACFVAGSMAGYSTLVGARADAVTSLNMLGSIFFGISPIAGWVQPSTGDLLDAALDTSGTFWGAVCFFAGAALLLRADAAPTPRRPR